MRDNETTSTQTSMNPRRTPLARPQHPKALGWLIPGVELTAHTGGRGPYSYTLFASSAWGVREGGVNHRGQLFQGTALEPRLQPCSSPKLAHPFPFQRDGGKDERCGTPGRRCGRASSESCACELNASAEHCGGLRGGGPGTGGVRAPTGAVSQAWKQVHPVVPSATLLKRQVSRLRGAGRSAAQAR